MVSAALLGDRAPDHFGVCWEEGALQTAGPGRSFRWRARGYPWTRNRVSTLPRAQTAQHRQLPEQVCNSNVSPVQTEKKQLGLETTPEDGQAVPLNKGQSDCPVRRGVCVLEESSVQVFKAPSETNAEAKVLVQAVEGEVEVTA